MPPHPQLVSTYITVIGLGDGRHSVDIQSGTACGEVREREKTKSVSHSSVKWRSRPGKPYTGFFHTSTYQCCGMQVLGTQAPFSFINKASQFHLMPMWACLCENCLDMALRRFSKIQLSADA